MVVHRRESPRASASLARRQTVPSLAGCPMSACSAAAARCGMPAMPPKARRAAAIAPSSTVSLKAPMTAEMSSSNRLVTLKQRKWSLAPGLRDDDSRRTNSPGLAVLLAVGDEELLQRQRAAASPLRSSTVAPSAISAGGEVADRRAVGDVAADRAGGAHLHGAEPAHEFAEVGIERRQGGMARGVARPSRRAESAPSASTIASSPATRPSQMISAVAQLLGDPQADIGRARDERRVGMVRDRARRATHRSRARRRSASSSPTKRSSSSASLERRGVPSRRRARTRRRLARAGVERRIDDRPVAGAAAQIAGERSRPPARADRPRAPPGRARTGSSRCRACRSRTASRDARPSPAWTGCSAPVGAARSSTVITSAPSAWPRSRMQALTGS